jgi:hypothetical protein
MSDIGALAAKAQKKTRVHASKAASTNLVAVGSQLRLVMSFGSLSVDPVAITPQLRGGPLCFLMPRSSIKANMHL